MGWTSTLDIHNTLYGIKIKMKEILTSIEENVDQYNWEENSILRSVNNQTECKDVFEATCYEIGKYYSRYGIKAYKKKIQYKFEDFKMEIQFSSSGYNQKGDFIWLEITSGVYPNKLVKAYKEIKERLLPITFANTNLFDYIIEEQVAGKHITKGINILGEEKITASRFNESTVEYSRGINLYQISIDQFRMILRYINKIIKKSSLIVTEKKHLLAYLKNPTQRQLYWILEKRTLDYINMYYENEIEIQSRMNELIKDKSNPV